MIPAGERIEPFDLQDQQQLVQGLRMVTEIGGTIFNNIPYELSDVVDGSDPRDWAAAIAAHLHGPLVEITGRQLVISDEGIRVEARRQIHHSGMEFREHPDPRYRDPLFWGETRTGSSELRFCSPNDGSYHSVRVSAGTLWVMGGPSLFEGKRVLHGLIAPETDRELTIGSMVAGKFSE